MEDSEVNGDLNTSYINHLISQLNSYWNDNDAYMNAVESLSRMGHVVVPFLIQALNEKDLWLGAVEILVRIGEPSIYPLIQVLHKPVVGNFAFEALVQIGSLSVEPLIEILLDPSYIVRYWAIEALAEIGDSRSIPHLKISLIDSDEDTREAILHALEKLERT